MTPKQLKKATTRRLIEVYSNKARCEHSNSEPIYNELKDRLGADKLYDLRLAKHHMDNGEGWDEFNEAIQCLLQDNND